MDATDNDYLDDNPAHEDAAHEQGEVGVAPQAAEGEGTGGEVAESEDGEENPAGDEEIGKGGILEHIKGHAQVGTVGGGDKAPTAAQGSQGDKELEDAEAASGAGFALDEVWHSISPDDWITPPS